MLWEKQHSTDEESARKNHCTLTKPTMPVTPIAVSSFALAFAVTKAQRLLLRSTLTTALVTTLRSQQW